MPFLIAGATVNTLIGINSREIVTGNLTIGGVNYPYIATIDGLHWRTLPRVDNLTTPVNAISNNGKVFGNQSGPGLPGRGVIIDTNRGDEVAYVNYPGATATNLLGGNDNAFLLGRASGPGVPPFWTCRYGKFEPLVFAPEVGLDALVLASDTNNRGDLLVSWRIQPSGARHAGIQSANGKFQELVYPDLGAIALAESSPTLHRFLSLSPRFTCSWSISARSSSTPAGPSSFNLSRASSRSPRYRLINPRTSARISLRVAPVTGHSTFRKVIASQPILASN